MKEEQPKKDYIPDWMLERYRLEELEPGQRAEIKEALRTDPLLAQRLNELARSDAEILSTYPVAETTRRILEKQTRTGQLSQAATMPVPGRRRAWLPLGAAALSAAAVFSLFLLLVPRLLENHGPVSGTDTGTTRLKGLETNLHVYRKQGNQAVVLKNGQKARAQDVLQLGFTAAENYYAVILSLDGNGVVTLHLPENYQQDPSETAPLIEQRGQEILLPYSYKLDAAPLFERFFLVTSPRSFRVSAILDAARSLFAQGIQSARQQELPLPADFKQYTLLLIKENRS